MWTWVKHFFGTLLFDEAAAQRYFAAALYLVGQVCVSGGVVPGTTAVIPHIAWLYPYGALFQAAAFYMGAGGSLPGRKNGNGLKP